MARVFWASLLVALPICVHLRAQAPAASQFTPLEFEVASVKRNMGGPAGFSRAQTLGGGATQVLTNVSLADALAGGRPQDVIPANIVNVPGWARAEYYDFTVKGPAGSTPEQMQEMWRTLLVQRMKLAGHLEQREATTFNLVLANIGRLGPELKKSTLDCSTTAPAAQPAGRPVDKSAACGFGITPTSIVSGGATMDLLARVQLTPLVGAPVMNRTGLDGSYAFGLKFAPPHATGAGAAPDDLPDLFTALREQLGLKLESEKIKVPYLVIDHIERPSED